MSRRGILAQVRLGLTQHMCAWKPRALNDHYSINPYASLLQYLLPCGKLGREGSDLSLYHRPDPDIRLPF